ncbi:MAG: molybdate ABC transporter substrate-binding protein, partial [Spirochaetota bacterium]
MNKFLLTLCFIMPLSLCVYASEGTDTKVKKRSASPAAVELHVFAAASMTGTLDAVITLYRNVSPDVTIITTYDSSGTLKTQIQEGADCDLFISAAQKQMNQLDGACKGDPQKNPE